MVSSGICRQNNESNQSGTKFAASWLLANAVVALAQAW
jgi:hypothetical protein